MAKKMIWLTCPYCGNRFKQWIKYTQDCTLIATWCDQDESDGCGREFAYRPILQIKTEYFELTETKKETLE